MSQFLHGISDRFATLTFLSSVYQGHEPTESYASVRIRFQLVFVYPAPDGARRQADAGLGAFAAELGRRARDIGFGEVFEQRISDVPSANLLPASRAFAGLLACSPHTPAPQAGHASSMVFGFEGSSVRRIRSAIALMSLAHVAASATVSIAFDRLSTAWANATVLADTRCEPVSACHCRQPHELFRLAIQFPCVLAQR